MWYRCFRQLCFQDLGRVRLFCQSLFYHAQASDKSVKMRVAELISLVDTCSDARILKQDSHLRDGSNFVQILPERGLTMVGSDGWIGAAV